MNDFLNQIIGDIRERRQDKVAGFSSKDFFHRLPTLPSTDPEAILNQTKEDFFLIAECKKASPSKGLLCPDYDPVRIAQGYTEGGASAISILTEEKYFQGSPQHLQSVREITTLPLLWKDFIIHEEQIAQARLLGADILLLIFRVLPEDTLCRLLDFTIESGLLPLVEVFAGDDPEKIIKLAQKYSGQFLIGINNRDLSTFITDIAHSEKMYHALLSLHDHFSFISESGIETLSDMHRIREVGFRGALVGESLVKHGDPRVAVKQLLAEPSP